MNMCEFYKFESMPATLNSPIKYLHTALPEIPYTLHPSECVPMLFTR